MPGRSEHRRKLYTAAMKAFADAAELAKSHPPAGTPEWDRWQALVQVAMEKNAAYIKSLEPSGRN